MTSVIESECFEREVRIKSARIMRTTSFDEIAKSKKFKKCVVRDMKVFNTIAGEIVKIWRNTGPFDIAAMNRDTYISMIHKGNEEIPIEQFASVSQYLDECLLLKPTPQLSENDKQAINIIKKERKTEKKSSSKEKKLEKPKA